MMGLLAKFVEPESSHESAAALLDSLFDDLPPSAPEPQPLADTCPACGSAILWSSIYDAQTRRCAACEPWPSERLVGKVYFDGETAEARRRRLVDDDQLRWQFGGIDPWADYVWERYEEREVDGWSVLFPIRKI